LLISYNSILNYLQLALGIIGAQKSSTVHIKYRRETAAGYHLRYFHLHGSV